MGHGFHLVKKEGEIKAWFLGGIVTPLVGRWWDMMNWENNEIWPGQACELISKPLKKEDENLGENLELVI